MNSFGNIAEKTTRVQKVLVTLFFLVIKEKESPTASKKDCYTFFEKRKTEK